MHETINKTIHDWKDGVNKIPFHLATWSLAGMIAAHYWNPAIWIILAVNGGMEALDFADGRDTLGKSFIDFASRIALSVPHYL